MAQLCQRKAGTTSSSRCATSVSPVIQLADHRRDGRADTSSSREKRLPPEKSNCFQQRKEKYAYHDLLIHEAARSAGCHGKPWQGWHPPLMPGCQGQ